MGDLLIKDKNSIDLIQSNERLEMSLGYGALLIVEQGTAPDGTPYQAKFINFIGNHVALVKYGVVVVIAASVTNSKLHQRGINQWK